MIVNLIFLILKIYKKVSTLSKIRRPKRLPISRRILDQLSNLLQNMVWWIAVRHQPTSIRRLALRAVIIIQMHEYLADDAIIGRKTLSKNIPWYAH